MYMLTTVPCNIVVLLQVVARLGKEINDESSVCFWCWKNGIPIFCPALTDGSLGDMLFFHSYKSPGLVIDIVDDIRQMNDAALKAAPRKTGIIILGGGERALLLHAFASRACEACWASATWRRKDCRRRPCSGPLPMVVPSACSHDMRVVPSQQRHGAWQWSHSASPWIASAPTRAVQVWQSTTSAMPT